MIKQASLSSWAMRLTLLLMAFRMVGTLSPLVLFPTSEVKHGIVGLTIAAALENAMRNIRANAGCMKCL